MRSRLRVSFATRLLVGGLAIALALVVGVSAVLLVSRDRQTRGAALSNADNRAVVIQQLLVHITAATGHESAHQLAVQPLLVSALEKTPATDAVRALFTAPQANGDRFVAIATRDGSIAYTSMPPSEGVPDPGLPSVRAALAGADADGLELVQQRAFFDDAVPVRDGAGTVVGAVVDFATLRGQLQLFATVTQYPTAFIPEGQPGRIARLGADGFSESSTPPDLESSVRAGESTVHAAYTASVPGGSSRDVAGSFVPVRAAGTRSIAGYVGVEAPLSVFVGDTHSDEITLALIALLVVCLVAIAVFLFVDRFVRRPVSRLERGVARIAGGDYTRDVAVTSSDELGRLAASVNAMRAQIARNVSEIEAQRARLDTAVETLGGVSRALTTTTRGVPALQDAVVAAAASIAGQGAAAVLLTREGGALVPQAARGIESGQPTLEAWNVSDALLAGGAVRVEEVPEGWSAGGLVAVPMFYQDEVVGALAVITRAGRLPEDRDAQSLAALANSAAIALENTRLFEQERETVRRLRELDALKSDFLATVQHELRTPLTAIMGMSDLLEMCWGMWDDPQKLEGVKDIQVAARGLYDIVETIIDFSLIEADTLGLNPMPVQVRPAVEEALAMVAERQKGGLQVDVGVDVAPEVEVYADPERFRQVLRAVLDNAVKFTPAGGHVRVRSVDDDGTGMVRVDVVDDGVGITPEALPRIFERFFQADNTATRAFGGTGMGLTLVQRLVEAHGARIEVESEPGRGTRFTLVWPSLPGVAGGEARVVADRRSGARAGHDAAGHSADAARGAGAR